MYKARTTLRESNEQSATGRGDAAQGSQGFFHVQFRVSSGVELTRQKVKEEPKYTGTKGRKARHAQVNFWLPATKYLHGSADAAVDSPSGCVQVMDARFKAPSYLTLTYVQLDLGQFQCHTCPGPTIYCLQPGCWTRRLLQSGVGLRRARGDGTPKCQPGHAIRRCTFFLQPGPVGTGCDDSIYSWPGGD